MYFHCYKMPGYNQHDKHSRSELVLTLTPSIRVCIDPDALDLLESPVSLALPIRQQCI